jgi:hypothetical protein
VIACLDGGLRDCVIDTIIQRIVIGSWKASAV